MLIRTIAGIGVPREIPLAEASAWGMPCRRAPGLVVQERDAAGALWATRGMWTFVLAPGDDRFRRAYHVPTGPSLYWARNLAAVRRLTGLEECVELLPGPDGTAVVMSAGRMFRRGETGRFSPTLQLRYYGRGVGSGVASTGITRSRAGSVYFGEYHQNRDRDSVRVYASEDGGGAWRVAHEFEPGRIKHLHVIEEDPFGGALWVGTGDRNEESMVIRSGDGLATHEIVGSGDQRWRTLTFLFSREAVLWGTDTGDAAHAGLYRYDRETARVERIAAVPECFFFGTSLASGSFVLSTDRHGDPIERDRTTRLWLVSADGEVHSVPCGEWRGGRYAILRLPRGGPHPDVALTCLNQTDHHGDLLIFNEAALRDRAEKR